MKEAYYFSHDANARLDDKILELRSEFGWHGYGLFWAIIETLRDCSNYTYPSNATAGLALSLNIAKAELETFILKCLELHLLVEEDGSFYSESLMKRMEDIDEKRRKRAEAGRKGGNAKAMLQQSSGKILAKPSKEKKEKESKVKEKYSNGAGDLELFESIRLNFPGTKRGKEIEFEDFKKKYESEFSEDFFKKIYHGIEAKKRSNAERERSGQFVPEWPHLKTYLNQRRWEEQQPEIRRTIERNFPAGAIQSGPLAGMVM